MPNHCTNRLTVIGDADTIRSFREKIALPDDKLGDDAVSILPRLYPTPSELHEMPATFGNANSEEHEAWMQRNKEKYGATDWYDWCVNNWGTKWGDYDSRIEHEEPTVLGISFTTAWAPALEGITYISNDFPTLNFIYCYDEGGMGFLGTAWIRNGIMTDREGSYPEAEQIPAENPDDEPDYDWGKQMEQVYEICNAFALSFPMPADLRKEVARLFTPIPMEA